MSKTREVSIREDIKDLIIKVPVEDVVLHADKLMPPVPVKEKSGTLYYLPAGVGHKLTNTDRAVGGGYERSKYNLSEDTFITKIHGTEEVIEEFEELDLDSLLDEEEMAGIIARNRLLLGREKKVADALFDSAVFTGAGYAYSASGTWDTADFRDDIWEAHKSIRTRLKLSLKRLSLLVTGDRIRDMVNTLAAKESIKYTRTLDLETDEGRLSALTQYVGVKEIVDLEAMADKAGLGLEANFDFLYPNDQAMLCYLAPKSNSWRMPGIGRQPVYSKLTPDYRMESYDIPDKDLRVVRAKDRRGTKVFKEYGIRITGIA